MAMPPELQAEMDRDYEAWLCKLTPETLPRGAVEALDKSDEEFERQLQIAFLAEQLEEACIGSGEFVTLPYVRPDGSIKMLWKKKPTE